MRNAMGGDCPLIVKHAKENTMQTIEQVSRIRRRS